jgi:hypothetical protein
MAQGRRRRRRRRTTSRREIRWVGRRGREDDDEVQGRLVVGNWALVPASLLASGRWSVVGGRWSVVGGRWSVATSRRMIGQSQVFVVCYHDCIVWCSDVDDYVRLHVIVLGLFDGLFDVVIDASPGSLASGAVFLGFAADSGLGDVAVVLLLGLGRARGAVRLGGASDWAGWAGWAGAGGGVSRGEGGGGERGRERKGWGRGAPRRSSRRRKEPRGAEDGPIPIENRVRTCVWRALYGFAAYLTLLLASMVSMRRITENTDNKRGINSFWWVSEQVLTYLRVLDLIVPVPFFSPLRAFAPPSPCPQSSCTPTAAHPTHPAPQTPRSRRPRPPRPPQPPRLYPPSSAPASASETAPLSPAATNTSESPDTAPSPR